MSVSFAWENACIIRHGQTSVWFAMKICMFDMSWEDACLISHEKMSAWFSMRRCLFNFPCEYDCWIFYGKMMLDLAWETSTVLATKPLAKKPCKTKTKVKRSECKTKLRSAIVPDMLHSNSLRFARRICHVLLLPF